MQSFFQQKPEYVIANPRTRRNSFVRDSKGNELEVDDKELGSGNSGIVTNFKTGTREESTVRKKVKKLLGNMADWRDFVKEIQFNEAVNGGPAFLYAICEGKEVTDEKLIESFVARKLPIEIRLILPRFNGDNLGEVLGDSPNMPGEEANFMIAMALLNTAKAIQEMHAKGILHGDIKEDNVMVSDELEAKVIDFGKSYYIHENATWTGSQPPHWSPERVGLSHPVKVKASFKQDVFSFGNLITRWLPMFRMVLKTESYNKLNELATSLGRERYFDPTYPASMNEVIDKLNTLDILVLAAAATAASISKTTASESSSPARATTDSERPAPARATTDSERPAPARATTESERPAPARATTDSERPAPARATTESERPAPARATTESERPAPTKITASERSASVQEPYSSLASLFVNPALATMLSQAEKKEDSSLKMTKNF